MKVERRVYGSDEERTQRPRPSGNSISFTQANVPCDLRLRFRRARVKTTNPTSAALVYGRAFHGGIEAYLRRAAKTPEQAVKAALATLQQEIVKQERYHGVRWDEWHSTTLKGEISREGSNFGSLPHPAFAAYWLSLQVPLWIAVYGSMKVVHSEHRVFVPLRPPAGVTWANEWSAECWMDFVTEPSGGGWQITDTKTAGEPWQAKDIAKNSWQAHLYMGAQFRDTGDTEPSAPFQFQIVPRTKAAHDYMLSLMPSSWPHHDDGAKLGTLLDPAFRLSAAEAIEGAALQVIEVPFDLNRTNTYINGVLKPKVNVIESNSFVANPTGWWCAARWCDYHAHCAFGTGTHL